MLKWLIKKMTELFRGAKHVGPTVKKMAPSVAKDLPEEAGRLKAWWNNLPEWLRIVGSVLWAWITPEPPVSATA